MRVTEIQSPLNYSTECYAVQGYSMKKKAVVKKKIMRKENQELAEELTDPLVEEKAVDAALQEDLDASAKEMMKRSVPKERNWKGILHVRTWPQNAQVQTQRRHQN